MSPYSIIKEKLIEKPKTWFITGIAGFIGLNILEALLRLGQRVIGIDNFSTSNISNLEQLKNETAPKPWSNFSFINLDIAKAIYPLKDIDHIIHLAAIPSGPRSIKEPEISLNNNIIGFLNILESMRNSGNPIMSLVYASSSSVYGNSKKHPRVEHMIGDPLTPYAASKQCNEIMAHAYIKNYFLKITGLRYFNVFGPRQNPYSDYSAVIPKWINTMLSDNPSIEISGRGAIIRDFCYIKNVVQATILAAMTPIRIELYPRCFNICTNDPVTLNQLYQIILRLCDKKKGDLKLKYRPQKDYDVDKSYGSFERAQKYIGYTPTHSLETGLKETIAWFKKQSISANIKA